MQAEWQQFLIDQGAILENGVVAHFTDPGSEAEAVLHGDAIASLDQLGVIRASGDDARQFLHAQLSNDVEHLEPDNWRLAAYCSAKGRALAVLRLFEATDHSLYIILSREIIDATLKRLRMFVLMSRVTLEDISDQVHVIASSGPAATATLQSVLANARLAHDGSVTILQLGEEAGRYLLIGDTDGLRAAWQRLAGSARKVGVAAWQLLDIQHGEPQVFAPTVDAFVPQMLNMHAIGGISFKKGCYPGQEIVARMYYLGKLKRRMYRAHAEQTACPAPGQPLFAAQSDSGQYAGQVVMASPAGTGIDLLIVAPVSVIEAGPVHLDSADGPCLEILPLPYEVPLERIAS